MSATTLPITTPLCFEMGRGGEALKYFRAHFLGGREECLGGGLA